jgi:DNA polymerase III epsilon subunit-like protein
MKYAIFDTETSGLFDFRQPADAPGQPRLAQLAVILIDDNLIEESRFNFYVRPDGWKMEPDATAVNSLTDEFLAANGRPIAEVLEHYVRIIDAGYVMAAYNAQYDMKVMRGELRRAGIDNRFERSPNTCLMRASMSLGIKKADGKGGWPKLADACAHFGISNEDAHSAGSDAGATLVLFRVLHTIGALQEPAVHYAKQAPAGKPAPADRPASEPRSALPAIAALPESF